MSINAANLGGVGSAFPLGGARLPKSVGELRTRRQRPRATRPARTVPRPAPRTRRSSCGPLADERPPPGRGGESLWCGALGICGRARRSTSHLDRGRRRHRSHSSTVVVAQGLKAVPFPPALRLWMARKPDSGIRRASHAGVSAHAAPVLQGFRRPRQGLKAVPKGPPVVRNTTFAQVRAQIACPVARARSSSCSHPRGTRRSGAHWLSELRRLPWIPD